MLKTISAPERTTAITAIAPVACNSLSVGRSANTAKEPANIAIDIAMLFIALAFAESCILLLILVRRALIFFPTFAPICANLVNALAKLVTAFAIFLNTKNKPTSVANAVIVPKLSDKKSLIVFKKMPIFSPAFSKLSPILSRYFFATFPKFFTDFMRPSKIVPLSFCMKKPRTLSLKSLNAFTMFAIEKESIVFIRSMNSLNFVRSPEKRPLSVFINLLNSVLIPEIFSCTSEVCKKALNQSLIARIPIPMFSARLSNH